MIEALKSDEIVDRVGGRFKLCALVQQRLRQLLEGARPLVERRGRTDLEIAIQEVVEGKISAVHAEELPTTAEGSGGRRELL